MKYYMEVPVVGKLMVEVEAESEQEAKDKVFEGDVRLVVEQEGFDYVEFEWEMYNKVVQGNVYYGLINNISINEIED